MESCEIGDLNASSLAICMTRSTCLCNLSLIPQIDLSDNKLTSKGVSEIIKDEKVDIQLLKLKYGEK